MRRVHRRGKCSVFRVQCPGHAGQAPIARTQPARFWSVDDDNKLGGENKVPLQTPLTDVTPREALAFQ